MNATPGKRTGAHPGPQVSLLLVAGLGVIWSLRRALTERAALELLLDWRYPVWVALLAGCGVAVALAWRTAALPGPGLARCALSSCIGGAAVFMVVFPRFDAVWLDLSLGLVAGAFAGLLLVTPRARAFDLLLFCACAMLLVTELGLRTAGRASGSPLLAQPGSGPWRFVLQNMLPPETPWWGFPSNSEGHYDEDFTPAALGERVVAVIGDSFSVGIVHHSLHFTTVAEGLTGLRIDNYGAPGIGLSEYHDLLQLSVAPRAPELVMINLFVGNDLYAHRDRPDARWLRSWLDRENLLALQVPLRLLRLKRTHSGRSFARQPDVHAEGPEQLRELFPWMADWTLEEPTFDEESFLELELGCARRCLTGGDYEGTFELLRRMRALAGDIPLAVTIIPDEFQVEDTLWHRLVARSSDLEAAERELPQRLIGDFLRTEGIACLDLLPALRAQAPLEDGDRHLYHRRDSHFNARGNRVAGLALGEFLMRELDL